MNWCCGRCPVAPSPTSTQRPTPKNNLISTYMVIVQIRQLPDRDQDRCEAVADSKLFHVGWGNIGEH